MPVRRWRTCVLRAVIAPTLNTLIWDLLQVNILWGLVNLLPVYPLDGGQIARELFTLAQSASTALFNRCSFRSARPCWWPCML